ncbi:uncharacterized protein LOC129595906 [Paramacrobiotus metropolitanus]|uniref:uncharacterized protein LOC129595906 n=1 Tax=Paramacrobiotus metropolitanus TaxID=2943436 RepID=UPI0024459E9B|nr:uncharacterized protein LOC129595906 [Paramacrobiotus metropolitanus]
MEEPFLEMLKNCQKQITDVEKTHDALITCCVVYTFAKEIADIKSMQMNDYGMGKLQRVRLVTGEKVLPLPVWMESGVTLEAYFGRKSATIQKHSSGDNDKQGFEVSWHANIQLERVPSGCTVEAVKVAFINPDSKGSPIVKIGASGNNASSASFINYKLKNIKGQTYSECCRELGIFREAYCYVTLRVPLRLLIRKQLQPLRSDLAPHALPTGEGNYDGNDKVILKCGQSSVKVYRHLLVNISKETEAIFGKKRFGQVSVYEMDVSKDVVMAVLGLVEPADRNTHIPITIHWIRFKLRLRSFMG